MGRLRFGKFKTLSQYLRSFSIHGKSSKIYSVCSYIGHNQAKFHEFFFFDIQFTNSFFCVSYKLDGNYTEHIHDTVCDVVWYQIFAVHWKAVTFCVFICGMVKPRRNTDLRLRLATDVWTRLHERGQNQIHPAKWEWCML